MSHIGGLDELMFDRLVSDRDIQELKKFNAVMGILSFLFVLVGQFIFNPGWNWVYIILIVPLGGLVSGLPRYYRLKKIKFALSPNIIGKLESE